ncbi:MAG: flagellar export protein FliJ [Desulfuromonadaceae bacterium]|nr:flagellar export protein FliJ [Geobacteraceae bacterium]
MKPFKLQVVLDHRQRLEDLAQQKLSKAMSEEQNICARINKAQEHIESLSVEYEERQRKGMLSHEFMLYENRIEHQRHNLTLLGWEHKKAQDFVHQCREELADASKNKHLLAKLKEKKLADIEQELKHKEMNELDEMTILRCFKDDV